jgi:hypothetical protein
MAHEAKKQQLTGNIYKDQLKIKKQQEDLAEAKANAENDAALSTMINTSSPGE